MIEKSKNFSYLVLKTNAIFLFVFILARAIEIFLSECDNIKKEYIIQMMICILLEVSIIILIFKKNYFFVLNQKLEIIKALVLLGVICLINEMRLDMSITNIQMFYLILSSSIFINSRKIRYFHIIASFLIVIARKNQLKLENLLDFLMEYISFFLFIFVIYKLEILLHNIMIKNNKKSILCSLLLNILQKNQESYAICDKNGNFLYKNQLFEEKYLISKEKNKITHDSFIKLDLFEEIESIKTSKLNSFERIIKKKIESPFELINEAIGSDENLLSKYPKIHKNSTVDGSCKRFYFGEVCEDYLKELEKDSIVSDRIYFFNEGDLPYSLCLRTLTLKEKYFTIFIRPIQQEFGKLYTDKINDFQNKFVSTLSHELRTPVNGSIFLLEEVNEKMSQEKIFKTYEFNQHISAAINHLKIFNHTINDIFDFSKFFSNGFELRMKKILLKDLGLEIKGLITPILSKKSIYLNYIQDPSLGNSITSDPMRIKQVFLNLLTNANRHTFSGYINFGFKRHDDEIRAFVEDTGVGISKEKQKKLFEFMTSQDGTIGFGLTISNLIVKELNKRHNGFQLVSEEGKGSKFMFSISDFSKNEKLNNSDSFFIEDFNPNSNIPKTFNTIDHTYRFIVPKISEEKIDIIECQEKKNEEEEEFEEEAILSEKLSQERKKQGPKNFFEKTCQCSDILIVDDDLYNLLALRYLLEKLTLKVDSASNGEEAIQKVKEIIKNQENLKVISRLILQPECNCPAYRLIIMDLDMPIKNGLEATEDLLVIFSNYDIKIPIIACTAFEAEYVEEKCLQKGMSGFLSKPINRNSLKKIMDEYVFNV